MPKENNNNGAPATAVGATGIPPADGAIDPKEKVELEFGDETDCCIGCAVVVAGIGLGIPSNAIGTEVGAAAEAVDLPPPPTPAFSAKIYC